MANSRVQSQASDKKKHQGTLLAAQRAPSRPPGMSPRPSTTQSNQEHQNRPHYHQHARKQQQQQQRRQKKRRGLATKTESALEEGGESDRLDASPARVRDYPPTNMYPSTLLQTKPPVANARPCNRNASTNRAVKIEKDGGHKIRIASTEKPAKLPPFHELVARANERACGPIKPRTLQEQAPTEKAGASLTARNTYPRKQPPNQWAGSRDLGSDDGSNNGDFEVGSSLLDYAQQILRESGNGRGNRAFYMQPAYY